MDQRDLLGRIMEGYSLGDMASITGTNYDSLELRFRNAVYHIVQQNNREWVQIHESKSQECVTKN